MHEPGWLLHDFIVCVCGGGGGGGGLIFGGSLILWYLKHLVVMLLGRGDSISNIGALSGRAIGTVVSPPVRLTIIELRGYERK